MPPITSNRRALNAENEAAISRAELAFIVSEWDDMTIRVALAFVAVGLSPASSLLIHVRTNDEYAARAPKYHNTSKRSTQRRLPA